MSPKKTPKVGLIQSFMKSKKSQKIFIFLVTGIIMFLIIQNGMSPVKYNLELNIPSFYDITAPRDIVNSLKTEENATF